MPLIGPDSLKAVGRIGSIGFEMVALLLVGAYAGKYVGRALGNEETGKTVGVLVGIFLGFFQLFRSVQKLNARARREALQDEAAGSNPSDSALDPAAKAEGDEDRADDPRETPP